MLRVNKYNFHFHFSFHHRYWTVCQSGHSAIYHSTLLHSTLSFTSNALGDFISDYGVFIIDLSSSIVLLQSRVRAFTAAPLYLYRTFSESRIFTYGNSIYITFPTYPWYHVESKNPPLQYSQWNEFTSPCSCRRKFETFKTI